MNIDDESHLKSKFLKGTVKLPDATILRLPFLNHHPKKTGMRWLKSIRLTPEPAPEIMLHDILINRQSIFAGVGPIQARLLNRINTGNQCWFPFCHQQAITLILSGGEYNGFCEIELIEPAVAPVSYINLLAAGTRTHATGKVNLLVAEPTLMGGISNPRLDESFVFSLGRGTEFSHQIFEEDTAKYQTRPGFDGLILLSPSLQFEYPASVSIRRIQGDKIEEIGTKGEIVALLEYPCQ